ncbi:MAG: FAD-dependent oxidoreductase, partial [Pseudomonadota bacterium]
MRRIAIIGSGISGLGAAYALKDTADITIYEARDRLGGHAWTRTIDYDGKKIDVDVGFIVYNGLNYPNLIGFFDALGVETKKSDMSFSVSDPEGWEWASSVRGIFAQKKNLLSPKFHRFWRTILRFNDLARAELECGTIRD